MVFQIVRNNHGWILNDEGCVLIYDTDVKSHFWIPANQITFDKNNSPIFKPNDEISTICETNEMDRLGFRIISQEVFEEVQSPVVYEQEQEEDDERSKASSSNKQVWDFDETVALINAVSSRYEDMHHPKKKKNFWNIVAEELASQNIIFEVLRIKKKWENLIKTYKNTKDKNNSTGRGPTKFLFYDQLDQLLGDKPNNSSPHTIDVNADSNDSSNELNNCNEDNNNNNVNLNEENTESTSKVEKGKRKLPTMEYVKMKKAHHERKNLLMEEYHTQKLNILEKKILLEERRVQALEKLAANLPDN